MLIIPKTKELVIKCWSSGCYKDKGYFDAKYSTCKIKVHSGLSSFLCFSLPAYPNQTWLKKIPMGLIECWKNSIRSTWIQVSECALSLRSHGGDLCNDSNRLWLDRKQTPVQILKKTTTQRSLIRTLKKQIGPIGFWSQSGTNSSLALPFTSCQ